MFFGWPSPCYQRLDYTFNNILTRDWNICGWSFHSPLKSWRWLHARNVTEQHCDWSSIKPFASSNCFSKLIFVITSFYLPVFFFRIPFLSILAVPIPQKLLSKSLIIMDELLKKVPKKIGTICVFNAFC